MTREDEIALEAKVGRALLLALLLRVDWGRLEFAPTIGLDARLKGEILEAARELKAAGLGWEEHT